ncbi:hypothetical protein CANCADRAFT_12197, partial [Tortispora caseinolytica NRRL Y-17796]
NPQIGDITALKKQTEYDRALDMMNRLAAQVKPIMQARSLKIRTLAEFYPKDKRLLGLNVNRGAKILVRLRTPDDPRTFFPFEHCLGTLLHELVHNTHGPHNELFYKQLDQLWNEYEALQDKGYTGDGFYSQGQRLGRSGKLANRSVPLRDLVLKAAENRMKTLSLSTGSGQKLGGSKRVPAKPTRELLGSAAERRRADDLWCSGVISVEDDEIDGSN